MEPQSPLAVLLDRNRTEHRQRHKHLYWVTDTFLLYDLAAHRYDSGGGFPFDVSHLRLETTHLSAENHAHAIAEHFELPPRDDLGSQR